MNLLDVDMNEEEEIEENTLVNQYLTFLINTEEYLIGLVNVTEIIGIQKITHVPETPNYIKGVINLRGRVIPVMDVRLRFGLEKMDYNERTCIIVLSVDELILGVVVDMVSDVISVQEDDIESSANYGKSSRKHFVRGMAKVGDSVKMVIDVHELLFDKSV